MDKNKLALKLNGVVSLFDFNEAVAGLAGLIAELSKEVGGPVEINWEISRLETGSATVELRGRADDQEVVERVVEAYSVVGQAMQEDRLIPYSAQVAGEAWKIAAILGGPVVSLSFITAAQVAEVEQPPDAKESEESEGKSLSLGSVTGTVDSLLRRSGLRFTLYDTLFNKAVTCFLEQPDEEKMRDIWGKKVMVVGLIKRDPHTHRPTEVREIKQVELVEDLPPDSHRRARGILPWKPGDELPEVTIRRVRDDHDHLLG